MSEDELTTQALMKQSKRRLAETIQLQCRQVGQLNKELAVANWQAELLATQRDALLDFLSAESPQASGSGARYTSWTIDRCLEILVTDPRDVTHGEAKAV